MTTYSTVLKLELPGDGQQVGTWGQTTNKNFGQLVEQAITGVQTITMLDADYTLTNLNGTLDESRNAALVASGTNNAIRKIVIPLNKKLYTVSNQTVGGYAITIGASTGNYVTIPNGTTTLVYCDGTNTVVGINGIAGAFNVSGALTVTGNATVSGNTSLVGTLGVGGAASFTNTVGFSVTPTAPTQAPGTSNTTLATTAFTAAAVTAGLGTLGTMALQNANNVAITGGTMSGMTSIAGGTVSGTTGTFSGAVSGLSFSGAGTGLTGTASALSIGGNAATATNATTSATVSTTIASGATGTTQSAGDNSTKIATTAYVATAVSNATSALGTMSTQNANNVAITGGTITGSYGLTAANATNATNATTAASCSGNSATATTASNALAFKGQTKLGLGITGEVWNNLTGSKSAGVTYTNSRAYPIMVTIQLHSGSSGSNPSYIYVNGVVVATVSGGGWTGGMDAPGTTIVPPGATYSTNSTSAGSLWMELY